MPIAGWIRVPVDEAAIEEGYKRINGESQTAAGGGGGGRWGGGVGCGWRWRWSTVVTESEMARRKKAKVAETKVAAEMETKKEEKRVEDRMKQWRYGLKQEEKKRVAMAEEVMKRRRLAYFSELAEAESRGVEFEKEEAEATICANSFFKLSMYNVYVTYLFVA